MPQTVAVMITSAVVAIKAARVSFCIPSGCCMVFSFHQTRVRVRHVTRSVFPQRLPLPDRPTARSALPVPLGSFTSHCLGFRDNGNLWAFHLGDLASDGFLLILHA